MMIYVSGLQVNREHALLQEVGALEEDGDDTGVQRIEGLEAQLAATQAQIVVLMRLQHALVQHLLPEEMAKRLIGSKTVQMRRAWRMGNTEPQMLRSNQAGKMVVYIG